MTRLNEAKSARLATNCDILYSQIQARYETFRVVRCALLPFFISPHDSFSVWFLKNALLQPKTLLDKFVKFQPTFISRYGVSVSFSLPLKQLSF